MVPLCEKRLGIRFGRGGEGAAHEENQLASVKEALNYPVYRNIPKLIKWFNDSNRMLPTDNTVKNNVIINSGDIAYAAFSDVPESEVEGRNDINSSLMLYGDPGFADYSGKKYVLKNDSLYIKRFRILKRRIFKISAANNMTDIALRGVMSVVLRIRNKNKRQIR